MPFKAPRLPDDVAAQFREAHDNRNTVGFDQLYALSHAARDAGWSLGSIASSLDVTRESVRLWSVRGEEMGLRLIVPPPPTPPTTKADMIRIERARVRDRVETRETTALATRLPRLLELQEDAEGLRGPSTTNPEKASASQEYTALINEAVEAGVRVSTLAKALNIEVVTIYTRLRRGGYRPLAPSEVKHGRYPSWSPVSESESVAS